MEINQYDGNQQISIFFSFTEHIKVTKWLNFELAKFVILESRMQSLWTFQYFCRGNLPKSNVYPNQKVNVFQTDSLKAFTLQNDFSELRLTISSRNWKELLPVSAWASICLSVYLLQICCIFSEYLFLRTPLDSCFCCMDNCCFIGSE